MWLNHFFFLGKLTKMHVKTIPRTTFIQESHLKKNVVVGGQFFGLKTYYLIRWFLTIASQIFI
jgi:hypothetical protein